MLYGAGDKSKEVEEMLAWARRVETTSVGMYNIVEHYNNVL